MRARLIIAVLFGIVAGYAPASAATMESTAATGAAPPAVTGGQGRQGAPIVVWNRTIAVLHAHYKGATPTERAAAAAERIAAMPKVASDWRLSTQEVSAGEERGIFVMAGGRWLFAMLQEDVDAEAGETPQMAADAAVNNLRAMLEARASQHRLPILLKEIGVALAATLVFAALLWLTLLLRRMLLKSADRIVQKALHRREVYGFDLWHMAARILTGAIHALALAVIATLGYLWLSFVLATFPYTRPWGSRLASAIWHIFTTFALDFVRYMEDLLVVLVVLIVAKRAAGIVSEALRRVERGEFKAKWLDSETARVTRLLVEIGIWILAFTIAYPYIPGSETDAFKGVGVLVGLMVSLGSSGLVNQLMSGLVVIYSKTFRPGDYVHVGNDEGRVREVGFLATKIVTIRQEEITIPNAVLTSNVVTNYSRLAAEQGAIIPTTVTIGYDAPWRQVHGLLLLAADRTQIARKEPKPFVLQRNLGDFYVEYTLHIYIDRAEDRIPALSQLHAQIQDAFNEFGVQIMSPHFMTQPPTTIVVPKAKWFEPPAGRDDDST